MDMNSPVDPPYNAAILGITGSSSPSGATASTSAGGSLLPPPQYYEHDPAAVSGSLRASVLPQYSDKLEAIFNSDPWIQQNRPLDVALIKAILHKIRIMPSLFECPFQGCSEQHTQSTKATEHIEEHLGHRPFHCDVCNMTFRRAYDRDTHHARHEPVIEYCPDCNAPFVGNKNLLRHCRENCSLSRV